MRCHTFVVNTEIVLGEADVAKLVLRAPGARERGLVFVNGWVEPSKPLVQLLFLLVQSRVSVNHHRHQKPAARRLSRHGFDASFPGLACQQQARAACVRQCRAVLGFFSGAGAVSTGANLANLQLNDVRKSSGGH